MKTILSALALGAASVTSVTAADLPARMPVKAPAPVVATGYNWSGFYIGAHGGGGWSRKCFTVVTLGTPLDDGCHDGDGWLGGGQLGFNVQSGQFVFGVEFSGSWADISGSHESPLTPGDIYKTDINTILLLTGRVGIAVDRALLYVTGGGAWARDKFDYFTGLTGATESIKQNRTGWTVGAGIEYGFTPNWSIAVQYNYVDLGDKRITFTGDTEFVAKADQQVHLATARLNYRFGWGGPVVARY